MTDPEGNKYWSTTDLAAENHPHTLALGLVGHAKRVLELGPAAGHVTRVLLDRGCDVVAIEYDPEAAAAVQELTTCHVGDVSDPGVIEAAAADGPFDVVLAGDVLEHLADPLATLRTCRTVLNAGGYLVVSVPNIAHADVALALALGRFEYQTIGLLDHSHIHFFTRASILGMLDEAGFLPIDVRRVVRPVFDTELRIDREDVDPALVSAVLGHDEAETYQFVIRAVRHDGDQETARLAAGKVAAEDEAARQHRARIAAEAEAARLRDEVATLTTATDGSVPNAALDAARTEIGHLREHAAAQAEEIAALQGTRVMRIARPFRAAYGRIRGGGRG